MVYEYIAIHQCIIAWGRLGKCIAIGKNCIATLVV